MAKSDKFYFQNFSSCTLLSKETAEYLVQCLENYDPDNMVSMLANMHAIEHQADVQKHAMNEALAKAFVTPVEVPAEEAVQVQRVMEAAYRSNDDARTIKL